MYLSGEPMRFRILLANGHQPSNRSDRGTQQHHVVSITDIFYAGFVYMTTDMRATKLLNQITMVPTPQEPTSPQAKGISVSDSNRIVISGISGLYPLSRHIKDLSEILYNKENPVTAEKPRWDYNHPEVSQHVGLVPNLNTFDAQFFRVHFRLSQNMDSMGRKILEQSYQAIYDSGVSPEHLSGKKVGVFIGTCFSETEKASFYVATSRTGFGIAGCNKSMFANRVSYWLNAKGPSQSIDAAGCSSTVALEQAYLAMSRGDCEAAIVGGANLCLHPQTSLHYGRIIKICKDGKTKSFDQNADGCARSEAINVLFLQKAKDALRIYADVIHVKNKFFGMVESETGPRFGFYRDPVSMSGFLKEFYQEANISPKDVEYVEGFGSADTDADKVELDAIDKVFCDNRTEPLLVGSVISNLGYCEAASGITAITKVVLGYHSGELAGNLNYTTSRSDVEGIREGRMQILKDHQPFKRTYVGVNGISVTGINSHVLLHGHYKPKDPTRYQCSFPRLVTISARQDSAVENIISDLKSRPIDPEELALLHNIHSTKISGHLGRGFTILDTDENKKTVSLCEKADYFDGGDRPLWFVYSGMGSQWAGHSVGELGCAYADGCLTAEEMILSAYSRGLVSIETPFIRGSMAAVGIGFEEVSKLCPPEIEVACHNGPESSTISGPADIMAEFVARLTAKGIFAKEVPCSNIAYHSRYIAEAGPDLLKYLTDVIKTPKARSERWLSTSVPQSRWNEEFAKFSSAEYHTNNLLSPVLFEETSRLVPATAVLVEVAPHGLLQAILKRSLPPSCAHVPLTRRAHPDNARFLLEAIGKFLPLYVSADRKATAGCKFVISLHDSEHKYMRGHVIKGKTLFPFAGALVAVWDTLAMSLGAVRKQLSVQFRDVQLFAQPALHDSRQLRLAVTLNRGTGLFEVMDDISKVASGYINASSVHLSRGYSEIDKEDDALELNTQYIYRIFSERYHDYTGMFQSIYNTNASFTKGHIHWEDNWVTLIDGMLQLNTLRQPHNVLCQPVYIRNINIDMRRHHNNKITKINNFDVIKANINPVHDITSCGGVLMENIIFREISNPQENKMAVKALNFVPRFRNLNDIDVKGILQVFIQIVEENIRKHEINVVEIYDKKGDAYILNNAKEIMNEVPGVNIRFFDMRKCDVIDSVAKKADLVLVTKLSTDDTGEWGGEYYEPLQEKSSCNTGIYLKCTGIGDLESLQWVRTDRSKESGVPVQVHFAGPNLCDVKKAFGEIPDGNNDSCGGLGMDFSGITESGERVMGLVRGGALSDRVAARPELLWPVPEHWSLEDAATVPLPYAHAYYCLAIKSQLRHGMCILVHGGTGALGQAVISIALYLKCRVFAAVGDTHKKRLLLKLFPELRDNHILSSRDENFGDVVLSSTNGRGCDIVLTCGKRELKTKLQALMAEGIKNGVVRPLSRIVYAPNEAPRAFRLLAGSRHRGRVLLRLQPMPPLPTQPRLICSADRCQLLLSDDEGQAIQLANTLVSRGARTLHLHLQSPPSSYHPVFTLWQKLGVKVQISTEDLANSKSVLKLLTESSNMGLVEGIFVMITQALTDETHKHYESLVVNLDAAARKSCPTMKFFAIVGFNNFIGQQLCLSRGKDRLPAMTLNVVKDDKSIPVNEISNALEEGLNSMQPVLLAHEISDDDKKTLCESIAAIAGVIITKDTSESATLQDLGISLDRAQAVSLFLRHTQNISIDENKIPSLSIEKIRDLQGMLKESEFTPKRGLEALISYVDSDELLATVEMVSLPTLSHSSTMRDDELDTHLSSLLCIIPGVEGHHRRYRLMCERLKMRAFVLQPGLDKPDESLQEMTDRFAKILLKKLNANKKFYLLGYEMGVITALEIAAILEDHGLSGTVFCLGGGPDECQAELEHHLREATASSVGGNAEDKQALQQALVRHICTLMGGGSSLQLEVAKRDTFSWQEEVMASVRALRGRVAHSTQYARALIEASYARVIRAREHAQAQVAPRALRSRVVLLRSPTPQAAPDPHPLQRYSQLPLGVHDLRAPLTCAPDDLRVAAIIHQYVDDEVLKEFDNKNLCETYLLNADVFMTA
ncbi:hypothetical protein MSG28_005889 [Choristoneura fumiferana]|uniref:Uncharacterized protein n=1 Tax=Choristoneura fumiferana TaxID=7141 RepID=A0ACC0L1M3_CHOFU|nr:hypothetical protein MSG28_005889 [Choristoneura fumiferana]